MIWYQRQGQVITQILWDVIICPCPWYLLLVNNPHNSSSASKYWTVMKFVLHNTIGGYKVYVNFLFPSHGVIKILHDDVIKWKHFPRYWPFVRGIDRSPVNSPHKGQWRGALMLTLIYARINDWVNNREAGDLRRNRAHYDVIVIILWLPSVSQSRHPGQLVTDAPDASTGDVGVVQAAMCCTICTGMYFSYSHAS